MLAPHEILGITSSATIGEIEAAYRRKMLYSNPNNFAEGTTEWENATKMQEKLQCAYTTLISQINNSKSDQQYSASSPVDNIPKQMDQLALPSNTIQILLTSCILLVVVATSIYIVSHLNKNTPMSETQAVKPILEQESKNNIALIAEKILPSTVMIGVEDYQGEMARGSGFFVNNSGDILTNYHVVKNASEIRIFTNDKNEYQASIRAFDERQDLALLSSHTPTTESVPLKILDATPKSGIEIIAAGSPKGFSQTISNGIVSAIREDDNGVTYIQITAPISPGSSGGPIVNMDGDVVGVSTLIYTSGQNLNFAVSSRHLAVFIPYAERIPPMKLASKKKVQPISPRPKTVPTEGRHKIDGKGIPLPDNNGFMGHAWGCSLKEVQLRLPSLKKMGIDSEYKHVSLYSTYKAFKSFECKKESVVFYTFHKNRLSEVGFLLRDNPSRLKQTMVSIVQELSKKYGKPIILDKKEQIYGWFSGMVGIYIKNPYDNSDTHVVCFYYSPIWRNYERIKPIKTTKPVVPIEKEPRETDKTGIIISAVATCRNAPSIGAPAIGWPTRGTRVFIYREQYSESDDRTWYYVTYESNGKEEFGWISSKVVEIFD